MTEFDEKVLDLFPGKVVRKDPVSYTHLDVYKRQVCNNQEPEICV